VTIAKYNNDVGVAVLRSGCEM